MKLDWSRVGYFFFGLIIVSIGIEAAVSGEISFTRGTWLVTENPIRFWFLVAIVIFTGCLLIYRTIKHK